MGEAFAGRYEFVDVLGSGGMGTVWRAWDFRERGYLAAKVLDGAGAAALMRFIREKTFRISSPHVLAPLGWAAVDERVLFTMELVRGGSVASLIGDYGALPSQWVAVLLDQLLQALEAVHATGLVHRDIKPANLLLRPTGRQAPHLLLGDFGVAAPVGQPRITQGFVVVGTRGYLAPEQLAGADPDPRQDLFAAGMVAMEMLLGHQPTNAREELGTDRPDAAALLPLIFAMTEARPLNRVPSATEARRLLTTTGLLPSPGTAPSDLGPDGAPADIEVFDVLPELPQGWSPDGPLRTGMTPRRKTATILAALALVVGAAASWYAASHPAAQAPQPTAHTQSHQVPVPEVSSSVVPEQEWSGPLLRTAGPQDVLVGTADGRVFAMGNQDGRLRGPALVPTANLAPYDDVQRGDVDGDGFADLFGFTGKELRVARNDRNGGFTAPELQGPRGYKYEHRMVADVDADGYADILGIDSGKLFLMRNDTHGDFESHRELGPRGYRRDTVLAADVDADGYADILGISQGDVYLYRNSRAGDFLPSRRIAGGLFTPAVAALDVDDDRRADLLSLEGAGLRLRMSDGAGLSAARDLPLQPAGRYRHLL